MPASGCAAVSCSCSLLLVSPILGPLTEQSFHSSPCSDFQGHLFLSRTGGIRPPTRTRCATALTLAEREEISRAMAKGQSIRSIAARRCRAPSTVSREISRNGGQAIRALGLEVRAGLHTGECETVGAKVSDVAVHIAAGVAAAALPGQVLVSSTVKDLVAGSGLAFSNEGSHHLKGLAEEWRLFALDRK